jgi:hypothetical protein
MADMTEEELRQKSKGASKSTFVDPTASQRETRNKGLSSATYSASSLFAAYDESLKREAVSGGARPQQDDVRRASEKLYNAGYNQEDIDEWRSSGKRDRPGLLNKFEAKREVIRTTPGIDPEKMTYDAKEGKWATQRGYVAPEKKANPTSFGFVSNTHANQMERAGYRMPASASADGTATYAMNDNSPKLKFTSSIQSEGAYSPGDVNAEGDDVFKALKDLGISRRSSDGSGYMLDADQLKKASALMDEGTQKSLEGKMDFGGSMTLKTDASGRKHVASFQPFTVAGLEKSLEERKADFDAGAYGKKLSQLQMSLSGIDAMKDVSGETGGTRYQTEPEAKLEGRIRSRAQTHFDRAKGDTGLQEGESYIGQKSRPLRDLNSLMELSHSLIGRKGKRYIDETREFLRSQFPQLSK